MTESAAPRPTALIEFTVEPHPDPLVRQLLAIIDELRRENQVLKEALDGNHARQPDPHQ